MIFAWLVMMAAVAQGQPAPSAPVARERLAVLDVRAEGGVTQGEANLIAEIITADLAKLDKYEVMSAADVATLVGVERQRQMAGCQESESCFAEIGAALGARLVVNASVGAIGNLRVLSLRLYDSMAGKTLARQSATVDDNAALVSAAHELTAKLVGAPPAATARKSRSNAGWFVLGGAGVLAAVGAGVGIGAWSDYQSFKTDPFNDPLGDSARAKAITADVFYGAAIVTASVATLMLILRGPAPEAGAGF